jgi:hypothetical protein
VDSDEARRVAASVEIEVENLDDMLEVDGTGLVVAWSIESRWSISVTRRSGLTPSAISHFDSWARQRVFMLLTVGPERDGWGLRDSDEGWQVTGPHTEEGPIDPFL